MMLFLATQAMLNPNFEANFTPNKGLILKYRGVPVITGSMVQFYEPGWSKGYYSSNWGGQTVRQDGSKTFVTFSSADGKSTGTLGYSFEPGQIKVDAIFLWKGTAPVGIEHSWGHLSAPLLLGKATFGNVPYNTARIWPKSVAVDDRRFAPEANAFTFDGPRLSLSMTVTGNPAIVIDGTNTDAGWAQGAPTWWLGKTDILVQPNTPYKATFTLKYAEKSVPAQPLPQTQDWAKGIARNPTVFFDSSPRLIPQLEAEDRSRFKPIENLQTSDENLKVALDEVLRPQIARHWEPRFGTIPERVPIKAEKLASIPAEGFELTVNESGITIMHSDDQGLRNAIYTVSEVAWPDASTGNLRVPFLHIQDSPTLPWRGVHLFVGPKALDFQKILMDRLLGPLRFNRVLLQCERTEWKSVPEMRGGINMPRRDLLALFEAYRARQIEPIPMIQSMGHMEWLVGIPKYKSLALNPQVPYAIDPNKPEGTKLLRNIWNEAIQLLSPQTIHFGMDEVDMRGGPNTPAETTALWTTQWKTLGDILKNQKLAGMAWGDKMLAPGDAPDACLGDNRQEADARRIAIPKDLTITDWHYVAESNASRYVSLKKWQEWGHPVIASGWNRVENIYGFASAAAEVKAGYLQTIWAGYESSEQAMLKELDQFVAIVLAARASWSGETVASPTANQDFFKLMYGSALPRGPVEGWLYGPAAGSIHLDGWNLPVTDGWKLDSAADPFESPQNLELPIPPGAKRVTLLLKTSYGLERGKQVGSIVCGSIEVPLRMGIDLPSGDTGVARRASSGTYSAVEVEVPAGTTHIKLSESAPVGLTLLGAAATR